MIKRIMFALKHRFDFEYVVFDFKGQQVVRFLNYEDAKAFSESQVEYLPKIFVGVTK